MTVDTTSAQVNAIQTVTARTPPRRTILSTPTTANNPTINNANTNANMTTTGGLIGSSMHVPTNLSPKRQPKPIQLTTAQQAFVPSSVSSSSTATILNTSPLSSISQPIRQDIKELLIKAFQHADINKKGYLNREDLTVGITAALGYQPTEFEVDQFLRNANGESVTQELFINTIAPKLQFLTLKDRIRQAYLSLPLRQSSAFITLIDILSIFEKVAPMIPRAVVHDMFDAIDRDRDGRVTWTEFEALMHGYFHHNMSNY